MDFFHLYIQSRICDLIGGQKMRVMAATFITFMASFTTAIDNQQFAKDLERCIRDAARNAADAAPTWRDGCLPPTTKVDRQAEILTLSLTPFEKKYGYQAALWCSFYSARMSGEEAREGDPQPNNPAYYEWLDTILCPWDMWTCGNEELGAQ